MKISCNGYKKDYNVITSIGTKSFGDGIYNILIKKMNKVEIYQSLCFGSINLGDACIALGIDKTDKNATKLNIDCIKIKNAVKEGMSFENAIENL